MWVIPGFKTAVEPNDLLRAVALFVAAVLVGYLLYRILVARTKRPGVTMTDWGGDDILLHAIRNVVLIWFAVGGLFLAASGLPLEKDLQQGVERALLAIVILSSTWMGARVAADVIRLFSLRTEAVARGSSLFIKVAYITIFIIGVLMTLQALGAEVGPLLAALGIGGLAIALALQEPLANFFAGLQILATKKVQPGHYVQLESGEEGYVTDIDWRHTSIRELPNNMLLVPNSRLANDLLKNFFYPDREMAVLVQVGVHYDSDLDHVEQVTVDVATEVQREVAGAVPAFEPFIRYHTFGESSIDFTVILRVREFGEKFPVKHEFIKRLRRRFADEGIVIPYPIRTIEPGAIPADASGGGSR